MISGEVGQAYNIANENTMISISDLATKFVRMTSNKISLKFDIQDIKNYGYNPEVKLKLKTKSWNN